jgi:hypothetical protein
MKKPQKSDSDHSDRDALDKAHNSDVRGEHRYADERQNSSERQSRLDRDKLKRRLQPEK